MLWKLQKIFNYWFNWNVISKYITLHHFFHREKVSPCFCYEWNEWKNKIIRITFQKDFWFGMTRLLKIFCLLIFTWKIIIMRNLGQFYDFGKIENLKHKLVLFRTFMFYTFLSRMTHLLGLKMTKKHMLCKIFRFQFFFIYYFFDQKGLS